MKLYLILFFIIFLPVISVGQRNKQPNIIIILTDDQGWGDLSSNGNANLETPRIDNLAENGVSFDRFFVCPVCSPTRAELLTGRYHPRGGVYDTSKGGERLDTDETTMSEIFKNAGYVTAAYGKWHNGMQPPYHPNARGFDDFYGFCSGHWGDYFSPMLEQNGEIVNGKGFLADDLTERGMAFIEKNHEKPFFLYLPLNTPHSPMQVPDKYWQKFEHKPLSMHATQPDLENLQHTRAALAMCENIDYNVGRLMEKLKVLQLEENTIVVYLSDNGPNGWRWNGGMKGRKGSVDEGGVRSPLLISWKNHLEAGKKILQIAGAIDLLPTLADLAGIEINTAKPLDGISLKPLLKNESKNWNDRYIFSYWNKKLSVRNQKYRFDSEGNLFDMETDPGQTTNISTQNPEITQQFVMAAKQWKTEVLAELPQKDERTFTIGHPGFALTQVPARDGIPHGNIKRSSIHPNCSFFTNWTSIADSITWDVEVLTSGNYEVVVYYTCTTKDVGSVFEIGFNQHKITGKITEPHDPPLKGMENDRDVRTESFVKDFKPYNTGKLYLEKGRGTLTLKALEKPGSNVMDFRMMMFKRL